MIEPEEEAEIFESPEKSVGERTTLFTNLNDVRIAKEKANQVHTPIKGESPIKRVFSSIKKLFTSANKSPEKRSPVKILLAKIEKVVGESLSPKRRTSLRKTSAFKSSLKKTPKLGDLSKSSRLNSVRRSCMSEKAMK